MKIGIMSMQRIINYGSFLQAYGLKKTIESCGDYKVQFVDYKAEPSLVTEEQIKKLEKQIVFLKDSKFYFFRHIEKNEIWILGRIRRLVLSIRNSMRSGFRSFWISVQKLIICRI